MSITSSKKVASNYLASLQDTTSILNLGVSQANVATESLGRLIEEAKSIIDKSTHKEHIYKEAGDLLLLATALLDDLQAGLNTVSYLTSKVDQKKLRNLIPAHLRAEIDSLVKRSC